MMVLWIWDRNYFSQKQVDFKKKNFEIQTCQNGHVIFKPYMEIPLTNFVVQKAQQVYFHYQRVRMSIVKIQFFSYFYTKLSIWFLNQRFLGLLVTMLQAYHLYIEIIIVLGLSVYIIWDAKTSPAIKVYKEGQMTRQMR